MGRWTSPANRDYVGPDWGHDTMARAATRLLEETGGGEETRHPLLHAVLERLVALKPLKDDTGRTRPIHNNSGSCVTSPWMSHRIGTPSRWVPMLAGPAWGRGQGSRSYDWHGRVLDSDDLAAAWTKADKSLADMRKEALAIIKWKTAHAGTVV